MTSAPDNMGDDGRRREPEVEEAINRLVSEGGNRLDRPLVPLLATGFVGGIGLVTSLRLLQAPHRVAEERAEQS